MFKPFKSFNRCAPFKPPTSSKNLKWDFLPRDAGRIKVGN